MGYARNIDHVVLGQYDIVTWFGSPYPEEFVPAAGLLPKLYVCPRCFKYTSDVTAASVHQVLRRLLCSFSNE
jgi:MYST family zinc finger domain